MTPEGTHSAQPPLFAVIRTRGPAWDHAQPIEGQADWEPHRAFMNSLEAAGFVLLAGPLEGSSDVLLIVRAAGPEEIASRFCRDPWSVKDLLRVSRISPWRLRLGTLP